jgi:sec-independent protein translocase protein TatA
MGEFGFPELLLIGIVLVVFFGPKKLPELGTSIGKAIKDFKRTLREPDLTEGPVESARPADGSEGAQQKAEPSGPLTSEARDH